MGFFSLGHPVRAAGGGLGDPELEPTGRSPDFAFSGLVSGEVAVQTAIYQRG